MLLLILRVNFIIRLKIVVVVFIAVKDFWLRKCLIIKILVVL